MTQAILSSPRLPRRGTLATYAAMGCFLGLVGPFGSYLNDGGILMRIAYWTATSLISCVSFDFCLGLVNARTSNRPLWLRVALVVLLANLPLSLVTHGIAVAIWPGLASIAWSEWYLQSVLVSLIYAFARPLLWKTPARVSPVSAPLQLGPGILCLQMEDHYVRVHTREGSRLVLSSFGRAMAELKAADGMQVHRSWWVARHAVTGLIEDGRNIRLKLCNGVEAPVSRTKVAQLRAAGWL